MYVKIRRLRDDVGRYPIPSREVSTPPGYKDVLLCGIRLEGTSFITVLGLQGTSYVRRYSIIKLKLSLNHISSDRILDRRNKYSSESTTLTIIFLHSHYSDEFSTPRNVHVHIVGYKYV